MLAMRALLIVFTLLTFASGIAAESSQPCAQISIESVTKVDPGTPIVFSSRVNNISSTESLTYRWQVSVGTIMAGQGTSSMTLDTTWLGGQTITVTVEVLGDQTHCSTSKSVVINPPPLPECAFDSYGDIRFSDEKARLDNFAIQIQNQPTSRGALITYAGNPRIKERQRTHCAGPRTI